VESSAERTEGSSTLELNSESILIIPFENWRDSLNRIDTLLWVDITPDPIAPRFRAMSEPRTRYSAAVHDDEAISFQFVGKGFEVCAFIAEGTCVGNASTATALVRRNNTISDNEGFS
jgi:hypothetical protein